MERKMLQSNLKDYKRNKCIPNIINVKDAKEKVVELKWAFAGHTARQKFDRWNRKIIQWRPWELKREKGSFQRGVRMMLNEMDQNGRVQPVIKKFGREKKGLHSEIVE